MKKTTHKQFPCTSIRQLLNVFLAEHKGVLANKSYEPLHRMRVASRRLRTAAWVFKSLFPKKEVKRIKKVIRVFSKATGQARDLDTLIVFVGEKSAALSKNSAHQQGLLQFAAFLKKRRNSVQSRVADAVRDIDKKKFRKHTEKLLKRYAEHALSRSSEVYELARKKITRRLDTLLACGDFAFQPDNVNNLHQLRIAAKHLRYTLEVFEGVLGKKTQQFIQDAWSIQRTLGAVHDYDVRILSLPSMIKDKKKKEIAPAIRYLVAECKKSRLAMYKEFLSTWKLLKKKHIWEKLRTFINSSR